MATFFGCQDGGADPRVLGLACSAAARQWFNACVDSCAAVLARSLLVCLRGDISRTVVPPGIYTCSGTHLEIIAIRVYSVVSPAHILGVWPRMSQLRFSPGTSSENSAACRAFVAKAGVPNLDCVSASWTASRYNSVLAVTRCIAYRARDLPFCISPSREPL